MEKYLKIGERYVQWIALGLGGLYLLLMAYFYVATPPITEKVDNVDYLPGEVDTHIKNGPVAQLEADIKKKGPWLVLKTGDPVADIGKSFDKQPIYVRTEKAPPWIRSGGTPGPTEDTYALVKPPAPEVSKVPPASGVSVVNYPLPVPAAPAVNPAGGAPAAAVAPAAVPVVPVVEPQDHDWNTYAWVVSTKALDDAFRAANINKLPPEDYVTSFLHVEVVRQELLPTGKFGPEKVLPDIPTVTVPPISLTPLPPETATAEEKTNYLALATSNASAILTPPFFEVVYGTKWYPPGTDKQPDTFAPLGTVPGAPPAPGAAPAPMPAPGGLPIGTGGGLRPSIHGPGGSSVPPPASVTPPPRYDQPVVPATPTPAPAMPTAPGVAGGATALTAPLNPALAVAQATDVTIYTHDWTVEPGHVYRYKMRYWISNPLFQLKQANVKKSDSETLSLASPYSQWTPQIEIPSRFRFWVQKFQRNNNNEVTFDVFIKRPGLPGGFDRSTVRAAPGDTIGTSAWLLVDVRQDPTRRNTNYYYFLISDPTGHIERRDVDKDSKDPDHLEMLDRTGAAAAVGG